MLHTDMTSFRIAGQQAFSAVGRVLSDHHGALGLGPPRSLGQACRARSSTLRLRDGRPRVCCVLSIEEDDQ